MMDSQCQASARKEPVSTLGMLKYGSSGGIVRKPGLLVNVKARPTILSQFVLGLLHSSVHILLGEMNRKPGEDHLEWPSLST